MLVKEYHRIGLSDGFEAMPRTPIARRAQEVLEIGQDQEDVGDPNQEFLDTDDTLSENSFVLDDLTNSTPLTARAKRAEKRRLKAAKQVSKALKSQEKVSLNVRDEDVARIARAIHGDGYDTSLQGSHPLATDHNIEEVINRNKSYCSSILSHNQALKRSIRQARRDPTGQKGPQGHRKSDEFEDTIEDKEEVVAAILIELGISEDHPHTGYKQSTSWEAKDAARKKKQVVQKLRQLILDDIEKHENQQRETLVRCAGFWRYCGQAIFERMTENARNVNWSTGENLRRQRDAPEVLLANGEDRREAAEERQREEEIEEEIGRLHFEER